MGYNLKMKTSSDINPDHQDRENLNDLTLEAIRELESGEGKRYLSFKSMIDDLEEYESS